MLQYEVYSYDTACTRMIFDVCLTALNSTHFGLPMIFPYGNCSAVPSPQSLTIYYSNMLNYSTSLGGFLIGGSAPIVTIGPTSVDDSAIVKLITAAPQASEFHHCLHYYCDQTPEIGSVQESGGICTDSDSITAFVSFIVEDPTVMSLVSHKIEKRVYTYSAIPVEEQVHNSSTSDQNTHTHKYVVLHGKPRNTTIPAVTITFPTVSTECANITITPKVDALIYRACHRDEFVQSTAANTSLVVSCLKHFEVVWIQPRIESCKQQSPSLQGTVIMSTKGMAVYIAEAECNETRGDRGFGYVGNPTYSLPPSRKWGTTFVTDLGHLQHHLVRKELAALFHMVAEADTEVFVTVYTPGRKLSVRSEIYKLEADQPLTIDVEETMYTYLTLKNSNPVLIVYEVYEKASGKPYLSSLLQPVEWFTQQQSLLLSHSLVPQVEQYFITLVITAPKSYDIKDIHIQREGYGQLVPLQEYFHTSDIGLYSLDHTIVVSVAMDSKTLGSNDTYLIAKSQDACMEIGASVVHYGEHSGYAHTNAYVLGEFKV